MPVTLTYPGVYIEELASTTHTIVGVATSITAFVGYTKRGPINQPTEVFSFGDFQRAFGGLDPDCPLTYSVQQFFLNGGSDAFIVRVAEGAAPATMQLAHGSGGLAVLELDASSAGVWGNALQVTVDQDTLNPASLFNLSVTEYVSSGGTMMPARSESFRNLTMNSVAPTYAVDTINNNSQLLTAVRVTANVPLDPTPLPGGTAGQSVSADQSLPGVLPFTTSTSANSLMVSAHGSPPTLVTLANGLTFTKPADIAAALTPLLGPRITVSSTAKRVTLQDAGTISERSAVHVTPAPANDLSVALRLGVAGGGTETDAIAAFHPMPTGTVGAQITDAVAAGLSGASPSAQVNAVITVAGVSTTVPVTVSDPTVSIGGLADLRVRLQAVLQAASLPNPAVAAELGGASVSLINGQLVVSAGGRPDARITLTNFSGTDKTAATIGFNPGTANVAAYSPATTAPLVAQVSSVTGADGTAPTSATTIIGSLGAKTGIYALEDVDLFNLLVLPDDLAANTIAVSDAAMTYCEQRRAMMIVDLPTATTSLVGAQTWIKDPGTPKSDNAAAYFPRALFQDPTQSYRPRVMPVAGAIAGLYARTDAARGVWKAPAGTNAALVGPTALKVPLTDMENGTINPLGLNAIRSLPVYGYVSWGARTLHGADVMASQWKYVPVRRTALYIEESLFRGTKWVVFEPNDDRLWAQIRLSVGSFMHGLFSKGAFQGDSPRTAYLVKCDSETTTQNDIDQGVVNILVGFAPLKPAEFVVIQITQLAGQLDT